jgi:hypothetical protein
VRGAAGADENNRMTGWEKNPSGTVGARGLLIETLTELELTAQDSAQQSLEGCYEKGFALPKSKRPLLALSAVGGGVRKKPPQEMGS